MRKDKQGVLLHVCCAPCSTVPIERLQEEYEVIGYFYNPNIYPDEEYRFRAEEMRKYFNKRGLEYIIGSFDKEDWYSATAGLEKEPEGGKRCEVCFRFRLQNTAETAAERKIPFFTTTLTLSPHKNNEIINSIGEELALKHGVKFIAENFKKKDGFKRSSEICREEQMYRQNYCGCVFSIKD